MKDVRIAPTNLNWTIGALTVKAMLLGRKSRRVFAGIRKSLLAARGAFGDDVSGVGFNL